MSNLPQTVLDHATGPHNRGAMANPSAIGRASLGGQPPDVIVYLQVAGEAVERAMFEAHGCGYTIACCSVLTEMVEGKPLALCRALTPAAILAELGEIPAHRRFCATLAVKALQDAIAKLERRTANQ